MCMFNALFIIDCWDDEWIRSFGAKGMRQFYGRMLDFLDQYEYEHVYLCTDKDHSVHPWIRSYWPKKRTTIALEHSDINLKRFKTTPRMAMCAGTSWPYCVHNSLFGLIHQMKWGFRVHSAPEVVRGPARGDDPITHRHFMTDHQIAWQSVDTLGVWRATSIKSFTPQLV